MNANAGQISQSTDNLSVIISYFIPNASIPSPEEHNDPVDLNPIVGKEFTWNGFSCTDAGRPMIYLRSGNAEEGQYTAIISNYVIGSSQELSHTSLNLILRNVFTKKAEPTVSARGDEMSLVEILEGIYDGYSEELPAMETIDLTDPENFDEEVFYWSTFATHFDGMEGAISMPITSSIAHHVSLVRVPQGLDVESVRAEIEEKHNPRK